MGQEAKAFNWAEIEHDGRIVTARRFDFLPQRRGRSRLDVDGYSIRHGEDPRFVIHNGQLYCTYTMAVGATDYKTCITRIDETHETHVIPYGATKEKNWCFFSLNGKLYAVYDLSISRILEFSQFQVTAEIDSTPLSWDYGPIRGSTPPVMVGDRLTMFFHSWKFEHWRPPSRANLAYRLYRTGYCEMESKPPFTVLCYSKRPIVIPKCSQYAVVFPCSARRCDSGWQLTCGFDDVASGRVLVSDAMIDRSMGCRRSTLVGA